MKRLLPKAQTVALFAVLALACATLASLANAHDLAMAAFALPIFAFAAWMGMRGSGQWAGLSNLSKPGVETEEVEEEIAA